MKFKDFPEAVINENVDYTVREITNVCNSKTHQKGNGHIL